MPWRRPSTTAARLVRPLGLVLLLIALTLAACGGEESESGAGGGTDTAEATLGEKPDVEVPEGPPPESLQTEDIIVGDGPAAQPGDTLAVQYVGVLYESGEEFDSSYERGEPFVFRLGAGMVIPGWDEGLVGMKEEGRRRLVIPPDLAYGSAGAPPAIGPDETLVFVVDLVEVR